MYGWGWRRPARSAEEDGESRRSGRRWTETGNYERDDQTRGHVGGAIAIGLGRELATPRPGAASMPEKRRTLAVVATKTSTVRKRRPQVIPSHIILSETTP